MDILSKLVGSPSPSPSKQANTPQQRSIRFKKVHEQLQQIWRRNKSSKQDAPAETVLICLESMKRMLQDEVQTPAPHLCARHISTFKVYNTLAQVASEYYEEYITHETLDIFKILIESEEVDFLEGKGFADALLGFISNISTTGPVMVSVDTEGRIVEVLFGVASKLRLQPKLLPTWFRPVIQDASRTNIKAEKEGFPLFYLTLDYVHHDGRVGDFARTGLLYIVESATHSEVLEKWVVESDLATLMASGLGALYSQLSRKLVLTFTRESMPAILTFSEAARPRTPPDAEKTTSPEFQAHLATFLSYLVFWQDILEHCSSSDVKHSLLDHFKFLFLQQLLYPSLIESSDVDGGSSVAVLTYLRCIIESIDNVELLHVTLHYLLALPDEAEEESTSARPTTLARRRKSQTLISTLAQGQEKPMPDLFTLVDLVLTSLRSRNQQTVTVTLQLVSVLLRSQHQYAVSSIIKSQPCYQTLPTRTIDAHIRDTTTLFSFAEVLFEHDDLGELYQTHLQDAQNLLESHCCSSRILALPDSNGADLWSIRRNSRMVQPNLIRLDDPLIESLVYLLEDFLVNDIGTNLSLTQTFSTLASCGNTRLECWLLGDPVKLEDTLDYNAASDDDAGVSDHDTITINKDIDSKMGASEITLRPSDFTASDQAPIGSTHSNSAVFSALDSLVRQVERFRHEIQEFDISLAERRHVFRIGEDIDKAVANDIPPSRRSQDLSRPSHSQVRGVPQIGSISQRLRSDASSLNVSRSSSPRGRQLNDSSTSTLVGRLNHLRISPSPSPPKPGSRTFSPSPLHKDAVPSDSIPSTPPKGAHIPMGPADVLRQNIRVKARHHHVRSETPDIGGSETSSIRSVSVSPDTKPAHDTKEVTLNHLLTNVIILQEFILELAAIVEVRASLFGEVQFV
ncbi:hypothetical protein N7G274_001302 [Stereocaulon virgatum]|uniref:DNA polymerase epsilon subunit C n=1 Tax=Stereocaulon virgatum TaxID=373712 RepID=A0ABR4AQ83_9LECA